MGGKRVGDTVKDEYVVCGGVGSGFDVLADLEDVGVVAGHGWDEGVVEDPTGAKGDV